MKSTRVSRRIDAPRETVYQAFLDATAVAMWLVPEKVRGWVHAFDPSEGGVFRFSISSDSPADGRTVPVIGTFHGLFVKLVPNQRIVQLMEIETHDSSLRGRMTVTITLAECGEGCTEVAVQHKHLPRGIPEEDNEAGWNSALERLAGLVERAVQHA